jgi:hypothetical protein
MGDYEDMDKFLESSEQSRIIRADDPVNETPDHSLRSVF